jgi:hypothetical protein
MTPSVQKTILAVYFEVQKAVDALPQIDLIELERQSRLAKETIIFSQRTAAEIVHAACVTRMNKNN